MSKIIVEHNEDNHISSFAFTTGKIIEELINEETDNLKERIKLLEAKILKFGQMTTDENFKYYFNIKTI